MIVSVFDFVFFSLVWGVAISGLFSSFKKVFTYLRPFPKHPSRALFKSTCVVKA